MKIMFFGALFSALLSGVMPISAAAAPVAALAPAAPTAPVIIAGATMPTSNVMPMGTPISFKMSEMLTTKAKKLETGYLAHLEVLDPVLFNGLVVIPAGSLATAEITDVRNKGMWGKSGRIAARMLYVTVGDRKIRLRGIFDDKGETGTAGVVAAIAFIPVAGFFTTGTSATLPLGLVVKGFTDEDVTLAIAAAPADVAPAAAPTATPLPPIAGKAKS